MNFYTGCLVGVVVTLVVGILLANYANPRHEWKEKQDTVNLNLFHYWQEAIDRQSVVCDHLGYLVAVLKDHREALSRIADAVTTWEQRYTRKKKATKPEEAS